LLKFAPAHAPSNAKFRLMSDGSLEGTTAPLEEIRFAVVFFLSSDQYGARKEHGGANPD